MTNSIFFLLALLIVVCISRSNGGRIDKCAEPDHSYRVCNAVRVYLQARSPCDKAEIIKLQRRINLLSSALKAIQHERYNEEVERQRALLNCSGKIHKNKCYFLLDEGGSRSMVSYGEASRACRNHQGQLVVISSKAHYDFIDDFIEKNARDFTRKARSLVIAWTGASYRNGQIYLPDNTTTNFAQWSIYHPMNTSERNRIGIAVAVNDEVRGMFDALPSMRLYPLCEKSIPS